MKRTPSALLVGVVALTFLPVDSECQASRKKVTFVRDSTIEVHDTYVKLLSGASFELAYPALLLPAQEVIVVFEALEVRGQLLEAPVFYVEGQEVVARHIAGSYISEAGYITRVVESLGSGAVQRLADGTLVEVSDYDRYHSGFWLPPYKVILAANQSYLVNLKKGKRITVRPVR